MRPGHERIRILLLSTVFLELCRGETIENRCREQCGLLTSSDSTEEESNSSSNCTGTCKLRLCQDGCQLWRQGKETACSELCAQEFGGSESFEVPHCIVGCNLSVDIYAQDVTSALQNISYPVLELGKETNESVILYWRQPKVTNVTYTLQKQVVELSPEWRPHLDLRWLRDEDRIDVQGLRPYVIYKFRVVVHITAHHELLSAESLEIPTKPYGVPSDPPSLLNITLKPTSFLLIWERPTYVNARLVGYYILWKEAESEKKWRREHVPPHILHKDFEADLVPETKYRVKVSAINRYGIGPALDHTLTTPPLETPSPGERKGQGRVAVRRGRSLSQHDDSRPYLVLGGDSQVLKQRLDLFPEPEVLYDTHNASIVILDVDIHNSRKLVFWADSIGTVRSLHMNDTSRGSEVVYSSPAHPSTLSVDWLNDKLYVGEENQIQQCSLEGLRCRVVVRGLQTKPSHIVADPCSGYLLWSENGTGLYRIDLASLKSGPVSVPEQPFIVYHSLNTFTVSCLDYKLYYPNETQNTIIAVHLGGNSDADVDIRQNVQQAVFQGMQSLLHWAGDETFYWSREGHVWMEHHYVEQDMYYHNEVYLGIVHRRAYVGLNMWHADAQPTPRPQTAPRNVQALFSTDSAVLKWNVPRHEYAEGAWKSWRYEVDVEEGVHNNRSYTNLMGSQFTLDNLSPDTRYSFRVRAFSQGGYGPWSRDVEDWTFPKSSVKPRLVYAAEGAISQVYLDGQDSQVLLSDQGTLGQVRDLVTFGDTHIWSTASHGIYMKEAGQPVRELTSAKRGAGALAYDWLSKMLYYTYGTRILRVSTDRNVNRPAQTIHRGLSEIQNIAIDTLKGYIYWTSWCRVEASRMDGKHDHVIIQQGDGSCNHFQGKLFLGLALDFDSMCLYWLYNDGENRLILYKSGLLGRQNPGDLQSTGEIASSVFSRSLEYFGGKLFWQAGIGNITVTDTRGQQPAVMQLQTGTTQRLAFCIDYADKFHSDEANDLGHMPTPVDGESMHITGSWNNFYLLWDDSVIHGSPNDKIFYKVVIDYDGLANPITNETLDNQLNLRGISPYTLLTVTIEAYTFWGSAEPTTRVLRSPAGTPSPPANPRIFVSHQRKKALLERVDIWMEFRWSLPEHPNGEIHQYRVSYTNDRDSSPWRRVTRDASVTKFRFPASPNEDYFFKVEACTVDVCSPPTDIIQENTRVKKPVPSLLTATNHSLQVFLPDEKTATTLASSDIVSLTYIQYDGAFYWLDTRGRLMEFTGTSHEAGDEMLATNGTGDSLTVDWISRDLFWVQSFPGQPNAILQFDLSKREKKYKLLVDRTDPIGSLVVNPYDQSLYWTERNSQGVGHLMKSGVDGSDVRPLLEESDTPGGGNPERHWQRRKRRQRRQSCTCPQMSVLDLIVLDQTRPENLQLYLAEESTGSIWAADLDGCRCRRVVDASSQSGLGLPPDSMTVDMNQLYWTNERDGVLHSVDKFTGDNFLVEATGDISNVVAFGDYLQPLPAPKCLMVADYTLKPVLTAATNVSLDLILSSWQPEPDPDCLGQSSPAVLYRIHYRKMDDPNDRDSCSNQCQTKDSYDPRMTLTELEPFSSYFIQVSSSNVYMDREGHRTVLGPPEVFTTKEGIPSPPREFTAQPITPEKVNVTWRSPEDPKGHNISYIIQWRTVNPKSPKVTSNGQVDVPPSTSNKEYQRYIVPHLNAGQKYYFKVLAFNKYETGTSSSEEVSTHTYQNPSPITKVQAKQTSLTISWVSPSDDSALRHVYKYKKLPDPNIWEPHGQPSHTKNATVYNETFNNLQANTEYAFRLVLAYKSSTYETYIWPLDERFRFFTGADVPGAPLPPVIKPTSSGVETIVWQPPAMDGGADIDMYRLSIRSIEDSNVSVEVVAYNLTELHWVVSGLESGERYVFHVAAMNSEGWGAFSNASTVFVPMPRAKKSLDRLTVILISTFTVLFGFVLVAIVILFIAYRRHKDHKPIPFNLVNGRTDTELATLRQDGPHITLDTPNALYPLSGQAWASSYAIGGIIPTDEDVAALPHYRRDQLTLTQFLGSGAFGEVFEGLARNIISEDSGDTKVAVKTLRKGATDQEKEEFLKEALLMSNFKHEHILRLLGVCLDNDPQFIILELMEGGDLLSYLRSSRPTPTSSAKLALPDMVSICCDVSKGCRYLEDMHFVHRDLAARNCLVSSKDPRLRMVKIGDFGLARDIYKNDYYRKEGEGLLPVRWMSPESLIDGVFAMQSDVWAFGVLMWEVLTLGQQPYPARNNIEVLHFVRGGGRLDRPDNCPDDLYHLMRECWAFTPQERPSFHYIHEQLESFKRRSSDPNSDFSGGRENVAFEGDTVNYVTHSDLAQASVGYLTHDQLAKAEINPPARSDADVRPKHGYMNHNMIQIENMERSHGGLNYLSHQEMEKQNRDSMSHEVQPTLNYVSHADMADSELNYVTHADMADPKLNYLSHTDMADKQPNDMTHADTADPKLNYLSHADMADPKLNYLSHADVADQKHNDMARADTADPKTNYLSHADVTDQKLNYLSHADIADKQPNDMTHAETADRKLNYLSHADMTDPKLNYLSHADMADKQLNDMTHADMADQKLNYLSHEDIKETVTKPKSHTHVAGSKQSPHLDNQNLNYMSHADNEGSNSNYEKAAKQRENLAEGIPNLKTEGFATPKGGNTGQKKMTGSSHNYMNWDSSRKQPKMRLQDKTNVNKDQSDNDSTCRKSEDFGDYVTLKTSPATPLTTNNPSELSQYPCGDSQNTKGSSTSRELTQHPCDDGQGEVQDLFCEDNTKGQQDDITNLRSKKDLSRDAISEVQGQAGCTQSTEEITQYPLDDITKADSREAARTEQQHHHCDGSSQELTQFPCDDITNQASSRPFDDSSYGSLNVSSALDLPSDITNQSDATGSNCDDNGTSQDLNRPISSESHFSPTDSALMSEKDITNQDMPRLSGTGTTNDELTQYPCNDSSNQTSNGMIEPTSSHDKITGITNPVESHSQDQYTDINQTDDIINQAMALARSNITSSRVDETEGTLDRNIPADDITNHSLTEHHNHDKSEAHRSDPLPVTEGLALPPRVPTGSRRMHAGLDEGDSSIPLEQPPKVPLQSPLDSTSRPVCVKRDKHYDTRNRGRHLDDDDGQGYLEPLVRSSSDHHKYLELVDTEDGRVRPVLPPPRPAAATKDAGAGKGPRGGTKKKLNYAELEGSKLSDDIDTDNPHALEGAGYYAPPRNGARTRSDSGKRKGSNGNSKIDYAELASSEADPMLEREDNRADNSRPRTDDSKMDSRANNSTPSSPSSSQSVPGYSDSDLDPKSRSGYMVPGSPARVVPDYRPAAAQYDRPRPHQLSPTKFAKDSSPYSDSSRGSSPFSYGSQQSKESNQLANDSTSGAAAEVKTAGNPRNGVPLNRLMSSGESTC